VIPYEVTIYTGDVEHAGCDCDVGLKLFGTSGAPSEHVIKKHEGMFERGSIDPFQVRQNDALAAVLPHSLSSANWMTWASRSNYA
jgi:hypothetical protein